MLKGAIFDHDGLMFDTEKLWQKNWQKAAKKRNVVLAEGFTHDICGTSGDLMNKVVCKYYHVEDGHDIMQEVTEAVQADCAVHIDEKPGLRKILDLFQKNGVRMAVASSSPESLLHRNLKNAGLDQYFDAVVSGQHVAHGKPAPDIFLSAAEKLNLDPKDCYVFEDAYNGVRAGHAAGCRTIMVPDLIQPDAEIKSLAAKVCTSLSEAADLIEKGL